MIERLRAKAQTLSTTDRANGLALSAGVIMMGAYWLDVPPGHDLTLLGLSLAYGAIGAGGLILRGLRAAQPPEWLVYTLMAVVTGIGLLFGENSSWWIALAAIGLLTNGVGARFLGRQSLPVSLLHLAGAVGGILRGGVPADMAWMVLALLGIGQAAQLFFLPRSTLPESKVMPFAFDMNAMIAQIDRTTSQLAQSAQTINESASQQASGAAEQAELLAHTQKLLGDFINLSDRIQEQARTITRLAKQAVETADEGQTAIHEVTESMTKIRVQVSAIAGTILALAQFTQRIDDIITSVSEIAIQSNLLALNASIEAARAGVQGRGFAVVAGEVRSLAGQSTEAAGQVRQILNEIQTAMKETLRETEEGLQSVDSGVERTQKTNTVMRALAAHVTTSHEAVNQVYEVIRQQMSDLEEITIGIERVDRITERSQTNSQSVTMISRELQRLAAGLQRMVGLGTETDSAGRLQNNDDDGEEQRRQSDRQPQENRPPE